MVKTVVSGFDFTMDWLRDPPDHGFQCEIGLILDDLGCTILRNFHMEVSVVATPKTLDGLEWTFRIQMDDQWG